MTSLSTDLWENTCRAVLLSCCPPASVKAASCSVTAPGPQALHASTLPAALPVCPAPVPAPGGGTPPANGSRSPQAGQAQCFTVSALRLHAADGSPSPSPSAGSRRHMPGADGASLRTQPPVTLSRCPLLCAGTLRLQGSGIPSQGDARGLRKGHSGMRGGSSNPSLQYPNHPGWAGALLSRQYLGAALFSPG